MNSQKKFRAIVNPIPRVLIVACFDPRFKIAIDEFPGEILELGDKEFILMKIGGGSTPLAYPCPKKGTPSRCKGLGKQILFVCKKFPEINEVVFISHGQCAYYDTIPCQNHQPGKEKRDLPLAGGLVKQILPQKKIRLFHAELINKDTEIVFEEVEVSQEIIIANLDWAPKSYQLSS